jgi:hypothetical protein
VQIFDSEGPVAILNLRGQVRREANVLAFQDNLSDDLRKCVFSFISLDSDRADFLRPVRSLYVSNPHQVRRTRGWPRRKIEESRITQPKLLHAD